MKLALQKGCKDTDYFRKGLCSYFRMIILAD
jgi:hypothetical protein